MGRNFPEGQGCVWLPHNLDHEASPHRRCPRMLKHLFLYFLPCKWSFYLSHEFLRSSDKPANIYCTSPSMHPHCHYSDLGPQRPLSGSWRPSVKRVCFPGIAPLTTNLPAIFLSKAQIWSYHFPAYHRQYLLNIHSFLKIYIWKCCKNCSHSYFLKNNY